MIPVNVMNPLRLTLGAYFLLGMWALYQSLPFGSVISVDNIITSKIQFRMIFCAFRHK